VPIAEALGLVLFDDVIATEPIPPFDNTSVDGYAVRAADVVDTPVELVVVGEVRAGQGELPEVGPGHAVKIMTGAPIPPGADAVVMVEDTAISGDRVTVRTSVPLGSSIRPLGDSVRVGDTVLHAGVRLRPAHLGVLAELGRLWVPVARRLRVGVISTGDELVTDGSPLGPGQIREANEPLLTALISEMGAIPVTFGIVADNLEELTAVIERAALECDALLTSGGVSMGEYDYVRVVLDELGAMEWMQIAIRPAKPFAFGVLAGSDGPVPVFGLPGNPVSSFVSFEMLARPALRSMMGIVEPTRPVVRAIADAPIRRPMGDDKQHLVRVTAHFAPDGRLHLLPIRSQGSHQLAASAGANAIAIIDDGTVVDTGDEIDVHLLTEL
jgi:molybdenum cofactor synthesis domain-containing protein